MDFFFLAGYENRHMDPDPGLGPAPPPPPPFSTCLLLTGSAGGAGAACKPTLSGRRPSQLRAHALRLSPWQLGGRRLWGGWGRGPRGGGGVGTGGLSHWQAGSVWPGGPKHRNLSHGGPWGRSDRPSLGPGPGPNLCTPCPAPAPVR